MVGSTSITLLGSWTSYRDQDAYPFSVSLKSGVVRLQGLLGGGSASTDLFNLPLALSPGVNRIYILDCFSAQSGVIPADLFVSSNGRARVRAPTDATITWCSMDGITWLANSTLSSSSSSGTSFASNDALVALAARVSVTESMLAALNHTGDWQSSIATSTPTSTSRKSWVANPSLIPLTVQQSGVYLILAQARIAAFDSLADNWSEITLVQKRVMRYL